MKKKTFSVKKVVRLLVQRKDGKFLCVQDYDNKLKIGFPGGGVDPGENISDAAVRELQEETGLIAKSISLIDISFFMNKKVFTFLVNDCDGKLKSSHEGKAGWCVMQTLLSGIYKEYYFNLFKKLGLLSFL